MAYFFGFFGISFLDKNAMARSPSSFGLHHLGQQLYSGSHEHHADFAKGAASHTSSNSMCSQELPPAASPVKTAAPMADSEPRASLGSIPEGEEYCSMSNDEVRTQREVGRLWWTFKLECLRNWEARSLIGLQGALHRAQSRLCCPAALR